jgi:hypothetical protein
MGLKDNLASVNQRIQRACERCGRTSPPTLLAASKGQSTDKVKEMHQLGLDYFGENYAQEMIQKAEELNDPSIKWVFMGHIQSNKIKKIVAVASEIQTVSSLKHAKDIERHALDASKTPFPIYLSINLAEESQKSGVSKNEATELYQAIKEQCPNLDIKGLMAVPPKSSSEEKEAIPPLFQELAQLAKSLGLQGISLGMSRDLEQAIAAGSTCVRIGTDLFGQR